MGVQFRCLISASSFFLESDTLIPLTYGGKLLWATLWAKKDLEKQKKK